MTYQLLACCCDSRVHECLLCSILFHKSTGSLVEGWQNIRSNLKFSSVLLLAVKLYIFFTLWHPNYHYYCLIYWELDMRSCKVLLNSYAESQTSHTFKEQENLKRALGYWKVIIICLYSALERSGTSCIIMHDFMCESSLKQMVHIIVGYHKDWKTRGQSISWGQELTHWMKKSAFADV